MKKAHQRTTIRLIWAHRQADDSRSWRRLAAYQKPLNKNNNQNKNTPHPHSTLNFKIVHCVATVFPLYRININKRVTFKTLTLTRNRSAMFTGGGGIAGGRYFYGVYMFSLRLGGLLLLLEPRVSFNGLVQVPELSCITENIPKGRIKM